jgi:hypothetical protein
MEEAVVRLGIQPVTSQARRCLRLVELYFERANLKFQQRRGTLPLAGKHRLSALGEIFRGDLDRGRRVHRRFSTYLPAVIQCGEQQRHGILLNFSAGGMFVATRDQVSPGTTVEVKVGRPDRVEYLFTCDVTRGVRGKMHGLGCRFRSSPVELRYSA